MVSVGACVCVCDGADSIGAWAVLGWPERLGGGSPNKLLTKTASLVRRRRGSSAGRRQGRCGPGAALLADTAPLAREGRPARHLWSGVGTVALGDASDICVSNGG